MLKTFIDKQQLIPQYIVPLSVDDLLLTPKCKISKTKKICTLGPKTSTVQSILNLIDNGMNVARLNFSHGTHEGHEKYIKLVRQALIHRPYCHVSILLDTKGPQIRTGLNLNGKQISLKKGQILSISTDYSLLCTSQVISCSYSQLCQSVRNGSLILFADGKISSRVIKVNPTSVQVQILNDGMLGEKKNMCLPGCEVLLPTINKYDQWDILEFGVKHKVDFIAVSFARFKKDIQYIKQIISKVDSDYSQKVQIISKIENTQALKNLDQIIDASNGIMVARGDLGMETPLQKIVLIQKLITTKCLYAGKYVIIATQMLQSMQSKPRPTRAQVSDITNAILDLCDCTMTSGQTANGQFPSQTVSYMNKISLQTQKTCDYQKHFRTISNARLDEVRRIVSKVVNNSVDVMILKVDDIEVVRNIAAVRIRAYCWVFTDNQHLKKATALMFGVYCFQAKMFQHHQLFISQVNHHFRFQLPITILKTQYNCKDKQFFNEEIKLISQLVQK